MIRLLSICLVAMVSTQADAQSLVGKWDCEGRDGPGRAIRTLQDFRANGQSYHQANVAVGDRRGRMDATLAVRGRWQIKDNVIIEEFRWAKLRALSLNGQDISDTRLGRELAREMPNSMFGENKTSRSRIKFTSNDRFEMQGSGLTGSCTRR